MLLYCTALHLHIRVICLAWWSCQHAVAAICARIAAVHLHTSRCRSPLGADSNEPLGADVDLTTEIPLLAHAHIPPTISTCPGCCNACRLAHLSATLLESSRKFDCQGGANSGVASLHWDRFKAVSLPRNVRHADHTDMVTTHEPHERGSCIY